MARVAINGLGRIGRAVFKLVRENPELDLVAVNDLVPPDNLAYLLRNDSVYGRYPFEVTGTSEALRIDGEEYRVLAEPDPAQLPWEDLGIDLVFECTGRFPTREDLEKHVAAAGARCVILSQPPKGEGVPVAVHGVNRLEGKPAILSTASCTSNAIIPIAEMMARRLGVEKATMTTVHAYTAGQSIVDAPKPKEYRRGRAGGVNLVPASTGAAKATSKVLPEYEGRFDGMAVRAPVPVGSIADLVFVTSRETDAGEVNRVLGEEAGTTRYDGIVGVSTDEMVSSDIIGDPRASVVDALSTQVVGGDLVKVMSWYDNEWGYGAQMVREAARMSREDLIPERGLEPAGAGAYR
ncbi:MAG: type I glyceraldehyde-3-phosphate dehydrogenase [Coriobacteriia bacterium]|nr:type I glyceraldehyde-3-phosphate dehydrogenase [Coriobacteriia bacterium]